MSYKDLWNNTSAVIKQSQENQQIFEEFIASIAGRIDIEENYAYQLGELTAKLSKRIQKDKQNPNTLDIIISALDLDISRRISQATSFARQLKNNILNTLQESYQRLAGQSNQAAANIASIQREYHEYAYRLKDSKAQIKVLNRIREQESMSLEILRARFFINKQEEDKTILKLQNAQNDYESAEATGRSVIKQYNDQVEKFYENINKNLLTLEEQQKSRSNLIFDQMRKLLIFQVQMTRNFQYDVNNISDQLEKVNNDKDIDNFVNKHLNTTPKYSVQSLPKLTLTDYVIEEMRNKGLDEKIKFNKIHNRVLSFAKGTTVENITLFPDFPLVTRYVREGLKDGIITQHQVKLNQILEKVENRNFFQLLIKEIINQPDVNVTHLASVIEYFINKCLLKKDVFNIRATIKSILPQSNKRIDKGNTLSLYNHLISIPLWKNHGFWQASVFESIQEQLKLNIAAKGQGKRQSKVRENSIVISELLRSGYIMVMLGYSVTKTKELAGNYSRLYGLLQKDSFVVLKRIEEAKAEFNEVRGQSPKTQKLVQSK